MTKPTLRAAMQMLIKLVSLIGVLPLAPVVLLCWAAYYSNLLTKFSTDRAPGRAKVLLSQTPH